jgi:hypothetical protein
MSGIYSAASKTIVRSGGFTSKRKVLQNRPFKPTAKAPIVNGNRDNFNISRIMKGVTLGAGVMGLGTLATG